MKGRGEGLKFQSLVERAVATTGSDYFTDEKGQWKPESKIIYERRAYINGCLAEHGTVVYVGDTPDHNYHIFQPLLEKDMHKLFVLNV